MDHVAGEPILNVSERGDRAFIGIHPERKLEHAWAGNVVDLCPVGSLLSKDALHRARAWELDKAASVCTGCSQGCNVTLETRGNVVVRIRPRPNLAVNHYYMCDHGRLEYRWMNRGDRIEVPLVRRDGELSATDWDHALEEAARIVAATKGRALIVASARTSVEGLYLARVALSGRDVDAVYRAPRVPGEAPLPGVLNLALREERAPNAAGARLLEYREVMGPPPVRGASVVLVLDDDLADAPEDDVGAAGSVIYLGTVLPDALRRADVVLPITNTAEEDGSFVNRDGRVQRYQQAKPGPGMARPSWWVLGELAALAGRGERLTGVGEAFDQVAASVSAFRELSYDALGYQGAMVRSPSRAEVTA
jgi:NADH-quinone oxidoreductase subunit G